VWVNDRTGEHVALQWLISAAHCAAVTPHHSSIIIDRNDSGPRAVCVRQSAILIDLLSSRDGSMSDFFDNWYHIDSTIFSNIAISMGHFARHSCSTTWGCKLLQRSVIIVPAFESSFTLEPDVARVARTTLRTSDSNWKEVEY